MCPARAEAGETLVRHLAEDPAFEGIGYATAGKLWRRFGPALYAILAGDDPAALAEALGDERARALTRAWVERLAVGDVVVWLDEHAFDRGLAKKVVALWGQDARGRIHEDPYLMMALANWDRVDAAARSLGVAEDAPNRRVAAVEAALYARYSEGHTWISRNHLERAASRLLGRDGDRALEVAVEAGAIRGCGDGFQPAGAYAMERFVAGRLRRMIADSERGVEPVEPLGWAHLDEAQLAAVQLACEERFGIVTGGAGVGKTTVMRAVCEAREALGGATFLLALAGRAAARIREATGRPASTVAAFLRQVERGEVKLGPRSLVVLDEASMIDLPTAYRLLRRMPEEAGLMLVGDPAQLPPIGFGTVLHALVGDPAVPRVDLVTVYRQQGASGIPAVANAVREGRLPTLPPPDREGGVTFLRRPDGPSEDDVVDAVIDLGGFPNDVRVICPVKGGPVGVQALNERFHRIFAAAREEVAGYVVGEPVMFLRNDYNRGLRNGSLGTVLRTLSPGVVTVDFDGTEHVLAGPALSDLAHAYAITVHKAQGSQFRGVVFPFVTSRLCDRSLVYTAITRAVERTVVIGGEGALTRAVAREPAADRRQVGLGLHMRATHPERT